MGKFSPKERNRKQKKRSRGSSKYLKPGALAQLRYSKASVSKVCTDLGRKRVAVVETEKADGENVPEEKALERSPLMMSPVNLVKQNIIVGSPKTPKFECETESRLESLPIELLVKILCHLHHDQLRAAFHVSQRIRSSVLLARQFYFNFTTPDRCRQEMLRTMTPRPTEHWPFLSRLDGKGILVQSPHTPKAPRHAPRPPSRLRASEMRQVAAVLFQDSALPVSCMVPSVISKPPCKSLASNRVLFCEDELCQAVAQNKLR